MEDNMIEEIKKKITEYRSIIDNYEVKIDLLNFLMSDIKEKTLEK
jgi:hypothetical protein